jgi:hypothetical protein
MPGQTSTPLTGNNPGSPSARMDDHWELSNAPRFELHDAPSGTTASDHPNRSDSHDPTTGPDSGRVVHSNGDGSENHRGGLILSNYLPSAPPGYWDENALDAVVDEPIGMAQNNGPVTQPRSVSMAELWSDSTRVPDLSGIDGDESEHGQENAIRIHTFNQVNEPTDLSLTEETPRNGYELSNNTSSAHVNERIVGASDGGNQNHGDEYNGASRGRNNTEIARRRRVHRGRVVPLERMTPEATAEFWRGIRDNEREDDNGDANEDTDESMNRDATGNAS